MIQTIIVPLLSPEVEPDRVSEAALPVAHALAKQTGAAICLVSVLDREPESWWFQVLDLEPDEELAPQRAARAEYLAEVAARFPGDRAEQVVRFGDPATQVLAVARARPDPVVVIATHGRSMLGRLFHGSTTPHIVRSAPCPVLVVRPPAPGAPPTVADSATVLAPLDHSPAAESAIEQTLATLGPAVRRLHLVQTIEPLPRGRGGSAIDAFAVAERPARARLERVAERAARWGCRVTWEVRHGRPPEQIALAAAEQRADIIALPTPTRTGASRSLSGSIATTLLRTSPVPLLLVRPDPAGVTTTAMGAGPTDEQVYPTPGPPAAVHHAGEIMTRPVTIVREDTPLVEVVRTMVTHRIGGVAVVDPSGMLRGIITEADFAGGNGVPMIAYQTPRRAATDPTAPQRTRLDEAGRALTAARIMTQPVVTATEDERAEEVADRMVARGIAHIPVVRDGMPVGIVTRRDLLKTLLPETAYSAAAPAQAHHAFWERIRPEQDPVAVGAGAAD